MYITKTIFEFSRFFPIISEVMLFVNKRKKAVESREKGPKTGFCRVRNPAEKDAVTSFGRTYSRCTDPPWGRPRGCPPEFCPESSSSRSGSGVRSPGRYIRYTCWRGRSFENPPFYLVRL